MKLHEYWLIVRRSWIVIVTCSVLGAALGVAFTASEEDSYIASAQILVGSTNASTASGEPYNPPDLGGIANSLVWLLDEDSIAEQVADDLDEPTIKVDVTASVPKSTTLVDITATSTSEDAAIAAAKLSAEYMLDLANYKLGKSSMELSAFSAHMIKESVSTKESSFASLCIRNLAGGFLLGAFIGLIAAGIIWLLDKRVRSISEASRITGYTVLCVVPTKEDSVGLATAYDQLGALVQGRTKSDNCRTLITTGSSHEPTEVTTNLAQTLAARGESILIVSFGTKVAETSKSSDIGNLLAYKQWNSMVSIASTGVQNPRIIIGEEKNHFDHVLMEIPGTEIASGISLSASSMGTVLLVCDVQTTHRNQLQRAQALFERCGQNSVELVFINAPVKGWRKRPFTIGLG